MTPAEYVARARQYAPSTPAELQQAAQQMLLDGMAVSTVAEILRLDSNAVRALIGPVCVRCEQ